MRAGDAGGIDPRAVAHLNIVFGTDYDDAEVETDLYTSETRRWADFANDTITISKLAVTPGLRYDDANTYEGFLSPSLGLTYGLADKTLLRACVSRGFNAPAINNTVADWGNFVHNPDLKVEQVWSYQVGIETGLLKYVWLKVTGFRHDIKDGIVGECIGDSCDTWTFKNRDKIRRQGLEFEVKTMPVFNTNLSAGATFIEAEDRNSGASLKEVPTSTYDIGLRYDDNKLFAAFFRGITYGTMHRGRDNPQYTAFIIESEYV